MVSRRSLCLAGCFCVLTTTAWADVDSIGPNGIRSSLLTLNGAGVAIGQIETNRPGVEDFDVLFYHDDVIPEAIYRLDGDAWENDSGSHGLAVAGILIAGNSVGVPGVAPNAQLHSSALVNIEPSYDDILRTIQHVASRNGGDVRAINHSYGVPLDGISAPDGFSYLTMGLDWSAAAHNVLHVASGQNFGSGPLPADNYNGVAIAFSRRDVNGVFREVDPDDNSFGDADIAGRVWIDLLAPDEA